jgi:hypothetical protein
LCLYHAARYRHNRLLTTQFGVIMLTINCQRTSAPHIIRKSSETVFWHVRTLRQDVISSDGF